MAAQIDFSLESSAAEVAGERLESGVLSRMRDQVGGLTERLPAYCALVWFLA